tara:strand:- start:132 stop:410 length:279 start_codon:yes stop_codon:yes gene_type:complete
MKKHTNGPWLITTIDGDDCLMVGGGDGSDVVADIRTDRPEDEVEANAHLIASAPEMYEALKKLAECSKEIPLMKYEQGLVDKAIAHAEGREA